MTAVISGALVAAAVAIQLVLVHEITWLIEHGHAAVNVGAATPGHDPHRWVHPFVVAALIAVSVCVGVAIRLRGAPVIHIEELLRTDAGARLVVVLALIPAVLFVVIEPAEHVLANAAMVPGASHLAFGAFMQMVFGCIAALAWCAVIRGVARLLLVRRMRSPYTQVFIPVRVPPYRPDGTTRYVPWAPRGPPTFAISIH